MNALALQHHSLMQGWPLFPSGARYLVVLEKPCTILHPVQPVSGTREQQGVEGIATFHITSMAEPRGVLGMPWATHTGGPRVSQGPEFHIAKILMQHVCVGAGIHTGC